MKWFRRLFYKLASGSAPASPEPEIFDLQAHLKTLTVSDYRLIHKPTCGCPEGWTELPRYFSQGDGTQLDGCLNPKQREAKYMIDVLMPGESVSLGLGVKSRQPVNVERSQSDGSPDPQEAKK